MPRYLVVGLGLLLGLTVAGASDSATTAPATQPAGGTSQPAPVAALELDKAWQRIGPGDHRDLVARRDKFRPFDLEVPAASAFVLARIDSLGLRALRKGPPPSNEDIDRVRGILAYNGRAGALWLVDNFPRMSKEGRFLSLILSGEVRFQEQFDHLVRLLDDREIARPNPGKYLAPMPVYDDRFCDVAYSMLHEALRGKTLLFKEAWRRNVRWPPKKIARLDFPARDAEIATLKGFIQDVARKDERMFKWPTARWPEMLKLHRDMRLAEDPVPVALAVARRQHGNGHATEPIVAEAMELLVDHWQDERVVPAMEAMSKSGRAGGGGLTFYAGEAGIRLRKIQALQEVRAMLEGAADADQAMRAIRKVAADPAWRKRDVAWHWEVERLLVDKAIEVAGPGAADVAFELHGDWNGFVRRHPQAALQHLKQLGLQRVMDKYYGSRLEALTIEQPAGIAQLLDEWLAVCEDRLHLGTLVQLSAYLHGREKLELLLKDPRMPVYSMALLLLQHVPDDRSLAAMTAELQRRRSAGADPKELAVFEDAIKTEISFMQHLKKLEHEANRPQP